MYWEFNGQGREVEIIRNFINQGVKFVRKLRLFLKKGSGNENFIFYAP